MKQADTGVLAPSARFGRAVKVKKAAACALIYLPSLLNHLECGLASAARGISPL